MVESAAQRKFIGITSLYRQLDSREPRTFLRRNLSRVLNAHARCLKPNATTYEDMIANERRRAGWNFPTPAMLENLVKGRKPVLCIDGLLLRPPKATANGASVWRQHAHVEEEPEWLQSAKVDFKTPCVVTVSVLDKQDSAKSRKVIYAHSQQAVALRYQEADRDSWFEIKLANSFHIELGKLFVVTDTGTNGHRHWKRTITAKYSLEVNVQCENSRDSAEFLSRLESRELENYNGADPIEGILKSVWEHLPECPDKQQLLPMRRPKGHKSLDLRYGMELSMGWNKRKKPVLETYNKMRGNLATQQVPTPIASDGPEPERPRKPTAVRYAFQDGLQSREHTASNLRCIWCEGRREFSSLTHLMFHYLTSHDHYKFELEDPVPADDSGLVGIIFTLADKPAKADDRDFDAGAEYKWVAPQRPLDTKAYIAGDRSWTDGSQTKSTAKRGRPPQTEDDEPHIGKKRKLGDLGEIRSPKRRKLPVPDVPGVNFYHISSLQPIRPGEDVSDGEQHRSDDRLGEDRRHRLRELGLTGGALEFHDAFNRHVDTYECLSRRLTEESIMRFAKSQSHMLTNASWRRELEAKLCHLHRHGLVGDDLLARCLAIAETATPVREAPMVNGHGEDADMMNKLGANGTQQDQRRELHRRENGRFGGHDTSASPASVVNGTNSPRGSSAVVDPKQTLAPDGKVRYRWEQGKFGMMSSTTRESVSQQASPRLQVRSLSRLNTRSVLNDLVDQAGGEKPLASGIKATRTCLCGKDAEGARASIMCDGEDCTRGAFHLTCVGLDRRAIGWLCGDRKGPGG